MSVRNVAIVGCGIGRNHMLEGYNNHRDRFQVLAVCDLNEERLNKFADEFGIPRRTTSFDEVLGMADIDIIDVCTPPGVHYAMVTAALRVGKDVICEKPLVGNLAQVDEIIAAEREARGRVMPIFQYRWGDGYGKAQHLIRTGVAGKPYLATAETSWFRGPDYYAVPWRGKWDTELGGTLLTHAIHTHDLMTGLMGEVATVSAEIATRVNTIEVEDCAIANLRMQSGALVSLAVTVGSFEQITRLRLCFENVTMESTLSPYNPGLDPWKFTPRDDAAKARVEEALRDWQPIPSRFQGQMGAYADALDSNGPLPVTLADARRSLELLTAIYHSADSGTRVTMPISGDHPKYRSWRPTDQAA
ncbi:Gfo/Idh/MocA family protein [Roseomonas elaeocarpi]|uniref:Gfo/Idh/MocA family protein n=1 Tax=Roseomonas elaeocarpi TaxID=907779 RepID=A0ABV6JV43_9PROT